jgi:hypothetical protein
MNWTFNTITKPAVEPHNMRIERYALKWVKAFARERHTPLASAIRQLLAQAVAHWRKEGHTSGSPWGLDTKIGPCGEKITTVMLDADTLAGLREIMAVSGKTLSRLTSEILLDAMDAETAEMKADVLRGSGAKQKVA